MSAPFRFAPRDTPTHGRTETREALARIRMIRRRMPVCESELTTWLAHPDERVPLAVLGAARRIPRAFHQRIGDAIFRRATTDGQDGGPYNPLLDRLFTTPALAWMPTSAQRGIQGRMLGALADWLASDDAHPIDAIRLLRFRSLLVRAAVVWYAPLDVAVVDAITRRVSVYAWRLVEHPDLTPELRTHLAAWAQRVLAEPSRDCVSPRALRTQRERHREARAVLEFLEPCGPTIPHGERAPERQETPIVHAGPS